MGANEQLASAPASPPDGPVLEAIFGGLQREHDFVPLRVDGRLPVDLRGTLYRNGPAVFTAGRNPHWFDGTGAITAVRADGVEALGAVRVVHTPSADHDAGRADNRYSGFLQKMSWGQRVRAFAGGQAARNTASINVLLWQQRLFALMETTLPLEVDPVTLRSLGETDLHGVIPKGWNAHPHYVPARRTTYQFGLRIGPKVFLDVFALPDSGGAQRLASLALPGVMEVHDFFATYNHLVFVLPPLWCHPLQMLWEGSFAGALRWRPDAKTEVWIIPIDDPQRVVRLKTEPFFFWHSANAFERSSGGTRQIVLDLVRYAQFRDTLDFTIDVPAGRACKPQGGRLYRGEIDLDAQSVRWRRLADVPGEFPAVHPTRRALQHGKVWMTSQRIGAAGEGWADHLVCIDVASGAVDRIAAGPRCALSEPAIVARSDRENDVWLLALVRDLDAGATHLAIWDGERLDAGPVARAWFDQQLPPPLHGVWIPART